MVSYTLGEIASRVGGTVRGDAGLRVAGIKPLDQAGPDDLSFLAHPRYRRAATASRAAALIASEPEALPGRHLILVENPYAALASAMGLFFAPDQAAGGISPLAVIGEGTALGEGVSIGPLSVIGRRCVLAEKACLKPGVILGDEVRIGPGGVLHPGVVVYARSVLGARVTVHAGSVLGSDGFGYTEAGGAHAKIPQVGNVVIEDDVEIGACVTIDRATFGSTIVGRGAKIDNLVQVAHNVVIGEGSIVGAKSAVLKDLAPGSFVLGHPAVDHRTWKRAQAALERLPELLHRVARLEKALQARAAAPARVRPPRRAAGGASVRAGAARTRGRRPA